MPHQEFLSPPGLLMNLKYYVSPYDLFEDGTGAPVVLHENNGRSAVELLGAAAAAYRREGRGIPASAPPCPAGQSQG